MTACESSSSVAPREDFYHIVPTIYQEADMGAQLNVKSEDAYRLASRLSELTGESLTTVVTEALRERLDRQLRLRDRDARLKRLRAITADIRAAMGDDLPTSDHSWLYDDETGLPR
ncbi:MAG: type II toxin-antitoxin system VapB family antitoxin [Rhodopila sp.]|jgi:antitoxin VapB